LTTSSRIGAIQIGSGIEKIYRDFAPPVTGENLIEVNSVAACAGRTVWAGQHQNAVVPSVRRRNALRDWQRHRSVLLLGLLPQQGAHSTPAGAAALHGGWMF
jgi:hypothetical protein